MEHIERIKAAAKLDESIQTRLAELRAQEEELSKPITTEEAGITAALRTGDPSLLLGEQDPRAIRQQELAEVRAQIRKFEQARSDLVSDVNAYAFHQSIETIASPKGDRYRAAAQAMHDALVDALKALEAFIAERKTLTADPGVKHANAAVDLGHLRHPIEAAIKDAARIRFSRARAA